MTSRRKFVQTAGLSAVAAGLGAWMYPGRGLKGVPGADGAEGGSAKPEGAESGSEKPKRAPLVLGIAGYTFTKIPVDEGISMLKRVGITEFSIKDAYCPLDSSAETIRAVVEKFRSNGIHIYAAGVIYMKTEQEVDRAFEYGKNMGVDLIVCAPNPDLLSYTEEKVKAYNIRAAIHNHGPEDKLYPSPADVYNRIGKMDARMGLCLDIGHAVRAGADPVKVVGAYAPRIFDLHIKDLREVSKVAKPIELGRGVLDIPGLVKALNRIGYKGRCSIEHEMDMKDPLPGIAESAGYFRGVVKTLG